MMFAYYVFFGVHATFDKAVKIMRKELFAFYNLLSSHMKMGDIVKSIELEEKSRIKLEWAGE